MKTVQLQESRAMGVLAEFIQHEADHLRTEHHKRKEALDDWLRSIRDLNAQITQWIHDADSGHGLLLIEQTSQLTRHEALLGYYDVRVLSISFGGRITGKRVEVTPRARYVAASIKPPGEEMRRADGIVELRDGSAAAFYLFRSEGPNGDRWYIRNVDQWNADPEYGTVEPLDRDQFEAAVLSVLR